MENQTPNQNYIEKLEGTELKSFCDAAQMAALFCGRDPARQFFHYIFYEASNKRFYASNGVQLILLDIALNIQTDFSIYYDSVRHLKNAKFVFFATDGLTIQYKDETQMNIKYGKEKPCDYSEVFNGLGKPVALTDIGMHADGFKLLISPAFKGWIHHFFFYGKNKAMRIETRATCGNCFNATLLFMPCRADAYENEEQAETEQQFIDVEPIAIAEPKPAPIVRAQPKQQNKPIYANVSYNKHQTVATYRY